MKIQYIAGYRWKRAIADACFAAKRDKFWQIELQLRPLSFKNVHRNQTTLVLNAFKALSTLIRFQTKTELFCSVFKKICVHTYCFRIVFARPHCNAISVWKRCYTLSAHGQMNSTHVHFNVSAREIGAKLKLRGGACPPFWILTVEWFWWGFRIASFSPSTLEKSVFKKHRFQIAPLRRAFSNGSVFGDHFRRCSVGDSRIWSKTAPFSFENGLVWTGPKKLRKPWR